MLFDPDFMRKLERLTLVARKAFPGVMKGEKRSPKRGSSVEFADFREYTPGDDFRYVDWNVYGRLDKLFLKMFVEEEDLHFYVLLDASESMTFGEPRKIDYARRIAAALGYIALTNLDRVAMYSFSRSLDRPFRMSRGRQSAGRLFAYLEGIEAGGQTSLNAALGRFAAQTRRPGIVAVISDFLDPAGYEAGLTALIGRNYEVNVIHVLDEQELHPELAGDLRLLDAETGETREVTISGSLMSRYERNLEAFCSGLQGYCAARAIGYVRTSTAFPFEELVLYYLRRGKLLK